MYSKRVCVVIDYADTVSAQSQDFYEYLCKKEKVRKTVFACSYWAQVESFNQKQIGQKSRDTVPC